MTKVLDIIEDYCIYRDYDVKILIYFKIEISKKINLNLEKKISKRFAE